MMYSMCCRYQQDIARHFCTAMADLRIPLYVQGAEDASLPYMHIGFEVMKPVFRGKGRNSLECMLFSSHYSEAFVLHANRILYDLAQSLVCLEHRTDLRTWKSENSVSVIKPIIKETKQYTTVTWGATVTTKWIH